MAWVDELPEFLWVYRCSLHDIIGEITFNLIYGIDVMLSVKERDPSLRRQVQNMNLSEAELRVEVDILQERENQQSCGWKSAEGWWRVTWFSKRLVKHEKSSA